MGKTTDATMGGLDALVAAASSVAGQGKNRASRANRGATMDMIDPALQSDPSSDVADAMSVFLSNPAVVQLIAEYNAKKQHRQVSLYTQLLAGSGIPNTTPDTPVQQTRSGRISRPPVYHPPPVNPFQQFIPAQNQPPPNTQSLSNNHNNDQNQLQAIKDALENVSSTVIPPNDYSAANTSMSDAASYDTLLQAVNNDSSSNGRFWRPNELLGGLPSWTGLEATTLAQAAADSSDPFSQRSLGHGLPNGKPINIDVNDHGKRSNSTYDDTGDDSMESLNNKRYKVDSTQSEAENPEGLPEWPLPPTGKGGRKNMPREELLARRRARNRVAAQESRKKKKEFFGNIADQLKGRDQAFEQLQAHCQKLELEVEALRKVILGAGLSLPPEVATPVDSISGTTPGPSSAIPTQEDTSINIDSLPPNMDPPFHDLFTIDDNDPDDLDFVPPSSPKRGDGSDSEDSEDEDEPTPLPVSNTDVKPSGNKKGKRKSTKEEDTPITNPADTPIQPGEGEAEDVEEDLFLPIEDVDVPPRNEEEDNEEKVRLVKQAMNELHVDTPQQLMGVIKKMAETAGYGGVTEEQVAMLSKLLALGQAQGMSVW